MNKKTTDFLMRKVLFLSAIFFLTFTFSCKKDGKLSPDFDDGNLSVNFTDTFSIQTSLYRSDSLRTDLSNYHLLGLYNDSLFGPVSSSIYTQIQTTGVNLDFGTSPIIDSIVLTLDYEGLYGNTATQMTIDVFKLTTPLNTSTDYYSNMYQSHDVSPLASLSFIPNLNDSVLVISNGDTIMQAPHARIKLSNTFGQDILNNSPYTNNDAFTSLFNGLYITTQDSVTNTSLIKGEGSIAYFDLNSTRSTVSIYYHYGFSLEPDQYDFSINTEGVKYSRFAHDYTGTDVEAHLNSLPSRDTTLTYVSTMAGVKTKVEIPHIKDLAENGAVVINKAELIFTIENGTESTFDNAISTLSLVAIDANGDPQFLPDFFEGGDHYGGVLTDHGSYKTYSFNITRHIHQLVYNTTTDYGMYLIANGSSTTANRSVISSEKNSGYKIKLEITYSKL